MLTSNEGRKATSQVNKTLEEVENQVEEALDGVHAESERVLDEMARGREEGPYEFDERLREVAKRLDDGRHIVPRLKLSVL